MELQVAVGWTGEYTTVTERPSSKDISELIESLNWEEFNSVRLIECEENWIVVSGNKAPDGFAVVYQNQSNSYISKNPPNSTHLLIEVLSQFLNKDPRFNEVEFVATNDKSDDPNNEQNIRHSDWRVRFEEKRRRERKDQIVKVIISIVLMFSIGMTVYLWFKDDLKFVGQETAFKVGQITEIKVVPGRMGLIQMIFYQFEFEGTVYSGHYRNNGFEGHFLKGDKVWIKYSTNDPNVSRYFSSISRSDYHNYPLQ
ncbi:MAG: hypothetical protein RJQ09_20470 [Cyclobacteriaceae bacterium]